MNAYSTATGCQIQTEKLLPRPSGESLAGRGDLFYRGVIVVAPIIAWHPGKQLEVQWILLVAHSTASVVPEKECWFSESGRDAQVYHYPLISRMATDYDEDGVCLCDVSEILLAKLVGPAKFGRLGQFTAIGRPSL